MERDRILIADDNPDMIYLIRRGFKEEGYHIIEAHDGQQTLQKAVEQNPDLILLDLKMPIKDGFQVLDELKKNRRTMEIPVLILTVVSDEKQKLRALEAGASDFLVKPPDPAEIKARVRTNLGLRRANKALKEYTTKLERMVEEKTDKLKKYAQELENRVNQKVGVIREQNRGLTEDLKAARRIQRGFLPEKYPDVKGVCFESVYVPCQPVGGDFYDVFQVDENTLGLYIADVSGHGVPSAMITIFLKQEMRYLFKKVMGKGSYRVRSPAEVLLELNARFIKNNIGDGTYFVTVACCTYSLADRQLVVSLAGHHALPVIRRNNGEVEFVYLEGFPVGWFEDPGNYSQKRYILSRGDSLVLSTDGVFNILASTRVFSAKQLKQKIARLLQHNRLIEELEVLLGPYRNGQKSMYDDLTVFHMNIT
ncbi:MAG: SpoIIE family protein phosphatase [Spirochaetota bacterium]